MQAVEDDAHAATASRGKVVPAAVRNMALSVSNFPVSSFTLLTHPFPS